MYYWNHRIFKTKAGYAIKETYYDENDKIHLWDSEDIICSDTLEELEQYFDWMKLAFEKEILDEEKLLKEIRG